MRARKADDLTAIRLFENKTGRSVYTMDDVAQWIEEGGHMPMPEPLTPRQLLAKRLSRSAGAARCHDPELPIPYRPYHAVKVTRNGQFMWDWFNLDNPQTTEEIMRAATHPRREQALGIGVQVRADWTRFYRTHPTLQPNFPDFDLNWEINLRHGDQSEDEKRKAS